MSRDGSPISAYSEMVEPYLIAISFTVAVVLVALFAISAPLSTAGTLSLVERIGYFAVLVALCWPLDHALAAMLLHYVRRPSWRRLAPVTLVAGLFAAANVATVAYGLFWLFAPHFTGDIRWLRIYVLSTVVAVPVIALLYLLACQRTGLRLVFEGGVAAGRPSPGTEVAEAAASKAGLAVGPEARQVVSAAPSQNTGATLPLRPAGQEGGPSVRFLDRLPAALGRDVVYLKVRSHYVNVVTTTGSGALLMRFADAVAALGDLGMQVHRSYWVALRHVVGIERRAERTVLLLTGGEEVPVSRTHLAAVRDALPANAAEPPERHTSASSAR